MTAAIQSELRALGFARAGHYRPHIFTISPEWRTQQVVYVWVRIEGPLAEPVRVGIACGPRGFGRRYDHYNRWLDGKFKPADPREQKVRSLFKSGLGRIAEIWAIPVPDKTSALELEGRLRTRWGKRLRLDLMVRDSWAKLQMNAWRAAGQPSPVSPELEAAEDPSAAPFNAEPAIPIWLRPPHWLQRSRTLLTPFLWVGFLTVATYWALLRILYLAGEAAVGWLARSQETKV